MEKTTVGIAILTYKSKHHLPSCLLPLFNSSLKPKILIVDADSNDGSRELAGELGADFLSIPYREFNHGLTREKARQHLATDIVVFMTPDAYGVDEFFLEKLVSPLLIGKADLAYARQLPKPGASPYEALPRLINYPEGGHIRSWEDRFIWGSFLFFFSDSCAAYRNQALNSIGGFTECLLGEDAVAAAKILKKGGKLAYVAEAKVYHSHTYSLWQEFRRYFDTGIARKELEPYIQEVGKDSNYGTKFSKSFLKNLSLKQLPYGILQLGLKWLGYQMGKRVGDRLPLKTKKFLSSQRFYWDSIPYLEKNKAKFL